MGWSIEQHRGILDSIFNEQEKRYRISHVESTQASVLIEYEGEKIPNTVLNRIVKMFPEHVYVEFWPGITFPPEVELAERR